MQRDYSPFCHEGTTWTEEYVILPSGVELLSVKFTPFTKTDRPVILFIPGMVSIIENFRETLKELTRTYEVYYVETREKGSARINGRHLFTVEEITSDIVHFAEKKIPEGIPWVIVGYSLGATIAAESFSRLTNRPEAVILIEPNAAFPFGRGLRLLTRFAPYIYKPLKPLLKWYMRTFIIDTKEDLEMYLIYCRNIDTAIPERLGAAVRQLAPYRMDECLPGISVPSLVVVTSKDRLHNHDEGSEIARQIKGSSYLDMADNTRTHSTEMALEIEKFISSLAQRQAQEDLISQDTSSLPS
jgi:pimeloyl-ACP methyl ester carboxylesterase